MANSRTIRTVSSCSLDQAFEIRFTHEFHCSEETTVLSSCCFIAFLFVSDSCYFIKLSIRLRAV